MKLNLKPVNQQVIVITGASSGIGLATAKAAHEAGAKLVLVARNEEALKDIERDMKSGESVMHVVADVGKRADLERVASETLKRFGRFDTWINNAGSSVWGHLDEVSDEDHEKVMQTNFWGTLYGSNIAVKHLRQQGGALINIGSLESAVALPLHSVYSASKHAVKAITDSLRVELRQAEAPVSVTLVRPPAIDTMFNDHAKSYLPTAPSFPPPVYSPDVVARAILHAAAHPQRDVYIGNAKMFTRMSELAPNVTDWVRKSFIYDAIFSGKPDSNKQGALHNEDVGKAGDGHASGNYPGHVMQNSLYTRASQNPLKATAALIGAVGAVAMATRAVRRRG